MSRTTTKHLFAWIWIWIWRWDGVAVPQSVPLTLLTLQHPIFSFSLCHYLLFSLGPEWPCSSPKSYLQSSNDSGRFVVVGSLTCHCLTQRCYLPEPGTHKHLSIWLARMKRTMNIRSLLAPCVLPSQHFLSIFSLFCRTGLRLCITGQLCCCVLLIF